MLSLYHNLLATARPNIQEEEEEEEYAFAACGIKSLILSAGLLMSGYVFITVHARF
jgi:hypothetical protein